VELPANNKRSATIRAAVEIKSTTGRYWKRTAAAKARHHLVVRILAVDHVELVADVLLRVTGHR